MRIIGGQFKGRRFDPPANKWPTRPTTDFAKEGLFNILLNRIDFDATPMLDLFGGSGSHCYEMVSRGGTNVTYVDKYYPCIKFVNKTLEDLGAAAFVDVVLMDVAKFLKANKSKFGYIFAGPPYPLPWLDSIPTMVFDNQTLADDGLFVLEHNANHSFEDDPHFYEIRKYGGTHFSFFSNGN